MRTICAIRFGGARGAPYGFGSGGALFRRERAVGGAQLEGVSAAARTKRSGIRGSVDRKRIPDSAALHPGHDC